MPSALDDDEALWALHGLAERAAPAGAIVLAGIVELPDGKRPRWQEERPAATLLDADPQRTAEVLAALGNPTRLRLLLAVLDGKTTVQDLATSEGIGTTGQVYHHLRQLTATGWLRRTGGNGYEVPVPRVVPLLGAILSAQT